MRWCGSFMRRRRRRCSVCATSSPRSNDPARPRYFLAEVAPQGTGKRFAHVGEQRMLAGADEDFSRHTGRQLDVFAELLDRVMVDDDIGAVVARSCLLVSQRV